MDEFRMNIQEEKKLIIGRRRGFTLVEVLVAMAITGIVLAAVYATYRSQYKTYAVQEQVAAMQQNLRAASFFMGKEIRMAGFDLFRGDPDRAAGAGFTTAIDDTIIFTYLATDDGINNDGDLLTDEAREVKTIEYSLYDAYGDGDNDIGRRVGGQRRAVAENIEEIELYYTLNDGSQTLAPAAGTLNNIRSVQVTILARTERADGDFTHQETYSTPSGATWGPYGDGFRRRLLTTTIHCRNMGL